MKEKYLAEGIDLARVTVDYNKNRGERVKFQFPVRRKKIEHIIDVFMISLVFWIILGFPLHICLAFIGLNEILAIEMVGTISIFTILMFTVFKKHLPEYQVWLEIMFGSLKEVAARPKDIRDNRFQVPMFSNLLLQYECFGDFNKTLERIEIREYNFRFVQGKKRKNTSYWYANFYFKERPKDGKMIVRFI